MIKKTIAITFTLLVAYSLFVFCFQSKITRTAQNQYDSNIIKGEEYLYENGQSARILILGSSLASRLVTDSLGKTCFNLALGGMSIYDGFSFLQKSSMKPEVVLIEMNIVLRELNTALRDDVFHPLLYPLRQHIPILRKKYQPVSVFKALVRDRTGMKPDPGLYKLPKNIFDKHVEGVIAGLSVRPDSAEVREKFDELVKVVESLQSSGIRVVFFEMPFYKEAEDLPEPRMIREAFHKYFPASQYHYIPIPADRYETTDGLHLPKDEALRYTLFLKKNLKEIFPQY